MKNTQSDGFSYTYSSKQRAEIQRIRDKYVSPDASPDKLELLRRLDAGVTKKGTAVSVAMGCVGSLVLGTGMSLIMSDLADLVGLAEPQANLTGALLGLFGIALVATAYPIYKAITRRERKKIAPEIIRLSDELMK